jgi:hypothetical protein
MRLTDQKLVASEADPRGIFAGVIEDAVFDLAAESVTNWIGNGDGSFGGAGHGGDVFKIS